MAFVRNALDRYGDVLLAAAIVLLGLLQTALDNQLSTAELAANIVVAVGLGVLLAFRRRIPLLLLTVAFASAVAEPFTGESGSGEFFGLFVLVIVYTAAAHTDGWRMWLAGAMAAVMGIVVAANDPESFNVGAAIFFGLLFGVPWPWGEWFITAGCASCSSSGRRTRQRPRSSRSGRASRGSSTMSSRMRSA